MKEGMESNEGLPNPGVSPRDLYNPWTSGSGLENKVRFCSTS
jgi:hypothetical protein